LDNLHVSQGWFDSSVSLGEPGYEETIVNGLSVAAKVALRLLLCKLLPIIDNQAQVNFVQNKAVDTTFPNWRFDKGSEGRDMAELFDMKIVERLPLEIIIKVKTMLICLKSRCNMYRILTD
jgi:dihydroorotase